MKLKRLSIVILLLASVLLMSCDGTLGSYDDSTYKVLAHPYDYYVASYEFIPDGWFTGYNSDNNTVMVIQTDHVFRIERIRISE